VPVPIYFFVFSLFLINSQNVSLLLLGTLKFFQVPVTTDHARACHLARSRPYIKAPVRGRRLTLGPLLEASSAHRSPHSPRGYAGVVFSRRLTPICRRYPPLLVDHPVTTVLSPTERPCWVLTSATTRTRLRTTAGNFVPGLSSEYCNLSSTVTRAPPVKRQVCRSRTPFVGPGVEPRGDAFYVSGGVDDNLHVFPRYRKLFAETEPRFRSGTVLASGLAVPG